MRQGIVEKMSKFIILDINLIKFYIQWMKLTLTFN